MVQSEAMPKCPEEKGGQWMAGAIPFLWVIGTGINPMATFSHVALA
jgi:hypothetical protein